MAAKQDLFTSFGLLILRVGAGGMMLTHGIPKLLTFAEKAKTFPDPLGIGSFMSLSGAVGAEVFCSGLVILGLFTPVAAIPLAFTMFIALFVIHGADAWAVKEKAAIYLVVFTTLIFTGGGRIALYPLFQSMFRKRKPKAEKE
ncbi:DoxX family protein [Rubinisphaera italica]|uniref:DoxX n=1 Tax=Rubinisphaera italica TaxID=2527969 RepID=A0A5C5XL30_9PLAN|nr:DoxX family protein [Rubinisphaera italica]TWT63103.1 DoxX [Rubinisphaera italica]